MHFPCLKNKVLKKLCKLVTVMNDRARINKIKLNKNFLVVCVIQYL